MKRHTSRTILVSGFKTPGDQYLLAALAGYQREYETTLAAVIVNDPDAHPSVMAKLLTPLGLATPVGVVADGSALALVQRVVAQAAARSVRLIVTAPYGVALQLLRQDEPGWRRALHTIVIAGDVEYDHDERWWPAATESSFALSELLMLVQSGPLRETGVTIVTSWAMARSRISGAIPVALGGSSEDTPAASAFVAVDTMLAAVAACEIDCLDPVRFVGQPRILVVGNEHSAGVPTTLGARLDVLARTAFGLTGPEASSPGASQD